MVSVKVIWGNVAQVPADVILLTSDLQGKRQSEVDRAIERVAGPTFRRQLIDNTPMQDGELFHATAPKGQKLIPFGSVLYVADAFTQPLHVLVVAGLVKANTLRLAKVSIPLLRTSSLPAVLSGSFYQKTISELVSGVKAFCKDKPRHVKQITIAVYGDSRNAIPYIQDLLNLD